MTYRNMPYYVEQPVDYFRLKVTPALDPLKDFTINGVNVIDIDDKFVLLTEEVTEPLVAVNKNNPADRVSLTLLSTETVPQREIDEGVKSPIEREPVLPIIKNNVDKVIKKSFDLAKEGVDDVNDETDGEFEEPDEDDDDSIAIIKAKEKGSPISKLLEMLAG